jgi:hypothetical protein
MKSARYEKLIEAFGGIGQYVTDTQSLAKAVSELLEVLDHRERKIIFKRFGGTVEVDFEPAEAEIRFHVFGLTIACRSPVIEGRLFINSVNIVKGQTSFESKMEDGKANSFKSSAPGGTFHGRQETGR